MSSDAAAGAAPQELAKFYGEVEKLIETEMQLQAEEWAFLLAANEMYVQKFSFVDAQATGYAASVAGARERLRELPACYAAIEELESNITVIESIASGLDEYSRILEKRFAP
jgi:hypothetical protein